MTSDYSGVVLRSSPKYLSNVFWLADWLEVWLWEFLLFFCRCNSVLFYVQFCLASVLHHKPRELGVKRNIFLEGRHSGVPNLTSLLIQLRTALQRWAASMSKMSLPRCTTGLANFASASGFSKCWNATDVLRFFLHTFSTAARTLVRNLWQNAQYPKILI